MSLDFTKVVYVDGETVIAADNLNDIQDAILDLDSALAGKVNSSAVGAASGVASLDITGKVPSSQLPPSSGSLPITGGTMSGEINMGSNKITGLANGTNASDAVNKGQLDAAILGALVPSGSVGFASLPSLTAANLNHVYNVTDAFTTTADFLEGTGKNYPAGTNVAIINTGTAENPVYKYDVYGSFVDLSAYRTSTAQDLIDAGKADKVQNATNGNFAALDANGNPTDSGHKNSDYVASGLGITGASVGDLVRISAVSNGKPTAFTKAPLNEIKCNRNLLDNWYFVGGGSQLGYGVFPVNQRGQTSYPNSGYFIDRWMHALLSATIVAQYVTIANTTASPHAFSQPLNSTSAIKGKTVTLSFLTDTALVSATISLPAATSTDWTDGQIHIYGDTATYFGSIRLSLVNGALSVFVIVNANTNVNFLAAKVEIGSTQTLAHQENGAWVLNEVPDYATELAKCQAYLLPISALSRTRTNIVLDNVLGFDVPVPVTMAKTPAIVGTLRVSTLTGSFVTGFTFDVGGISDNAVRIRASKTSHGLTDGFIDSDAVWYLSAE